MKKILSLFALVLICVLVFCGCEKSDTNGAQSGAQTSTGGEPSVSESAAEVSGSEEQSQGGERKEDVLPQVEGPDAEGKFPAISQELYEKYIINSYDSERKSKKPDKSKITPFLENKLTKEYLKRKFPNKIGRAHV